MASLLPGYSHDVFISYRQKDNRGDKWVTEFVRALKTELDATFKEDISIYFDENPHDGLLETHHVDKSLEGKLKCLVFIPILSQTYCDPKSFAWGHEFCAFNKMAQADSLGRDIRLNNGNVTSRILPIKIHDLDPNDKFTIESEIGGALRAIEFIYKEPGVNRPLKPTDSKADNQNKTDYQNQINKTANAIKEIIYSIKKPTSITSPTSPRNQDVPALKSKRNFGYSLTAVVLLLVIGVSAYYFYPKLVRDPGISYKSVAVLPFTNMSNDSTQQFFCDGMAEDIYGHLTKISDLEVKSIRTTLQYKDSKKTIPEIADELNTQNLLMGSVRREGKHVRIAVRLVKANDQHVWSETYDRELEDVFQLQSEIALAVSEQLKAVLSGSEKELIKSHVFTDLTAYDYFRKAKEIMSSKTYLPSDIHRAKALLQNSTEIDPAYAKAYALWSEACLNDFESKDLRRSRDSALLLANKAISLDSKCGECYWAKYAILRERHYYQDAYAMARKAYELEPNNGDVMQTMAHFNLRAGNHLLGARMLLKALQLTFNKTDVAYIRQLASFYEEVLEFEKADKLSVQADQLESNPYFKINGRAYRAYARGRYTDVISMYQQLDSLQYTHDILDEEFRIWLLGWSHFMLGQFEKAEAIYSSYIQVERNMKDSNLYTPFRHRLAYLLWLRGEKKKANELFLEELKLDKEAVSGRREISGWSEDLVRYNISAVSAFLGDKQLAYHHLDSALFFDIGHIDDDPLFNPIRHESRFQEILQRHRKDWELRKLAMKQALREFEAGKLTIRSDP